MKKAFVVCAFTACVWISVAAEKPQAIEGWVIDSACAYTKNLSKPVSAACATECAKHGSPLVILAKDGSIFLPIDSATPAHGQNDKLLKYAGERVRATGQIFRRGGGNAIEIQDVRLITPAK